MSNASRTRLRFAAAAVASGALVVGGLALATSADASAGAHPTVYNFRTLDNANDLTFNQLLGINDHGVIAGYFGSGAQGHPNKGYELRPNGTYLNENFPASVQTQVTGLNNEGVTVGFWSDMNNQNQINDNFGFYSTNGKQFHTVDFPTGDNATPPVDQLLGVNDHDIAVGFYTNGQGSNRGYTYNIKTRKFTRVLPPGFNNNPAPSPSLTAAAINNHGDVAGIYNVSATQADGFLRLDSGKFITLAVPGASATQALGVNNHDEVVGDYTVGSGSGAMMHGFTWAPGQGFTTVDDPNGVGTTTINGVNDAGALVGFYVDSAGNTDGMLATPAHRTVVHLNLIPMPQGNVTVSGSEVTVSAFGLTPGSPHAVVLEGGGAGAGKVTLLGPVTADGTGQVVASLTAASSIPNGSRIAILAGVTNTDPIAQTSPLNGSTAYKLHAIEAGASQSLWGKATIVVDPQAQTISVTVNAKGLTPGVHAAHIHLGSCQSQGAVQYMLMDFNANSHGDINNETRVVTGVTSVSLDGGWYLNLHQGNSNNILQNGQPTIFFRPLLCANI